MASRFLAIGTLILVTAMATATVVASFRHTHLRPSAAPGSARLQVFGSRSAAQQHSAAGAKFDGALADLSRHAPLIRPEHAMLDLRSLSPAARFMQASPASLEGGARRIGSATRGGVFERCERLAAGDGARRRDGPGRGAFDSRRHAAHPDRRGDFAGGFCRA
jgi:hypothetical protein